MGPAHPAGEVWDQAGDRGIGVAIDLGEIDFLHGPTPRTVHCQPAIARQPRSSEGRRAQDAPAGSGLCVPGFDDLAGFGNLDLACFLLAAPLLLACFLAFPTGAD